jgi:hypothetical protein
MHFVAVTNGQYTHSCYRATHTNGSSLETVSRRIRCMAAGNWFTWQELAPAFVALSGGRVQAADGTLPYSL